MNAHEKSMDYFIELLRKDTVSFVVPVGIGDINLILY
jgi:hypothetical protein